MQVGSLCICVYGGEWICDITKRESHGPALNEIVTVCGFEGDNHLYFSEYPDMGFDGKPRSYTREAFRELQPPMEVSIENILHEKV